MSMQGREEWRVQKVTLTISKLTWYSVGSRSVVGSVRGENMNDRCPSPRPQTAFIGWTEQG